MKLKSILSNTLAQLSILVFLLAGILTGSFMISVIYEESTTASILTKIIDFSVALFVIGLIVYYKFCSPTALIKRYSISPCIRVCLSDNDDVLLLEYNKEFLKLFSEKYGIPKFKQTMASYLSQDAESNAGDINHSLNQFSQTLKCLTSGNHNLSYVDDSGELKCFELIYESDPCSIFSRRKNTKILRIIDKSHTAELVRENNELLDKNSNLLQMIGNELRVPIATSVMMVESGETSKDEDLNNQLLSLLNHSLESIGMIQRINTRTESDVINYGDQFVDLKAHIYAIYMRRKQLFKDANIDLMFSCPDEVTNYSFKYDNKRITNIVDNLLDNTFAHSGARTVLVSLNSERINDSFCKIKLTIEDDGVGISTHKRKHIFDDFGQSIKNTSVNLPGINMGLGLSAVKRITNEIPEGHITCHDPYNFNFGIAFTLEFVAEITSNQSDVEQTHEHTLANKNIVIADDVSLFRKLLIKILTKENANVREFSDGKSALQYIKSCPDNVDIVITDLIMPGYDGKFLIRNLKNSGFNKPIILMTGDNIYLNKSKISKLKLLGADEIIIKPISLESLKQAIFSVYDKKLLDK